MSSLAMNAPVKWAALLPSLGNHSNQPGKGRTDPLLFISGTIGDSEALKKTNERALFETAEYV